jgi:glycogenin glucosyltransferase
MRGDGYLPGALVLAYALKQQTEYDLICLVTNDISERARRALQSLYNHVLPISELRMESAVRHGRSDRNILLTRFEALRLGALYDKIILLDADVLPLGGYDGLFSLSAPAGVLFEPALPHGAPIPKDVTDRVRSDLGNMGVNAGLWVLEPSADEYGDVLKALRDPEIMALTERFPWPEMQLATLLWSGRWTNIDARYCFIGSHPRPEALNGIHLAGLKPWQVKNRSVGHYARYPDFQLWYQMYSAMYWSIPLLRENQKLRRLWEFCKGR